MTDDSRRVRDDEGLKPLAIEAQGAGSFVMRANKSRKETNGYR
jgi:hypothetical protein